MKTLVCSLFLSVLLLSLLPFATVSAAETVTTDDGFTYRLQDDGSATLMGYSGTQTELVLPSSFDGHPLRTVYSFCFRYNTTLRSVTVPTSVTLLAPAAFYECTALQEVDLQCQITTVSTFTFGRCSALQTLMLPATLTTIEDISFKDCTALQTVFFRGKDRQTLTIGDSNAPLQQAVWYDDAQRLIKGPWVLASYSDGTATVADYTGDEWFVAIPCMLDGHTVTGIGSRAFFKNSTMEAVSFSEGITSVDTAAFASCSALRSVTLPFTLRTLGADAFSNCTSLESFDVPDGVTHWPDGLLSNNSSLIGVTMPDTVTSMDGNVFSGCDALRSVKLSDNLSVIGESAFEGCTSLETVIWPSKLEEIEATAFYGCTALRSIRFPDSLAIIKTRAFKNCPALETVRFSENLLLIETEAFEGCTALRQIELPEWLYILGDNAFRDCRSLRHLELPDQLYILGEGAFQNCSALESVSLPRYMDTLRFYTFANCVSLRRVTLPPSLQRLEWGAFVGCTALKDVAIPASVTAIEGYTFHMCSALETVYYEGSEEQWASVLLDYRAFDGSPRFEWDAAYNVFSDIGKSAWYALAADHSAIRGWIGGFADGTFGADRPCQRQDVLLMLARIAQADLSTAPTSTAFRDVKPDGYYAAAVAWGAENGILTGYNDGRFGVGDAITREQLCTILYRMAGNPSVNNTDATLSAFADGHRVSPFAREAVAWAVENGLVNGMQNGRLAPTVYASRAHVATILFRCM